VVLNDVQSEIAGYTYAHYYTHYYGEEPGGRPDARRLGRVWNFLRRRGGPPAASAVAVGLPYDAAGDDGGRSRRRYRNILAGLGVIALLVGAIVAITAWNLRWFDRLERPKSLERRVSGALPADPPPRTATPAPPVAAPAPSSSTPTTEPPTPRPAASTARETPASDRDTAIKEPPPVAQGPRFAVEFGPFLSGSEAERTERQLNQAGHQTVRFRQQTGAALYAVLIERVGSERAAEALISTLRGQGFPDATGLGGGESITVRVGEPALLRAAVELAESLRAKGHQVRVAAQPGEAQTFVIRHGNFASREEAEARAAELGRLGLPNHVVRAK
jgi:cell division protein FtsN